MADSRRMCECNALFCHLLITFFHSVVTDLIKRLGSNILEGKSVINISLPVRIFEPRSFLQRITDVWCYAPLYLTQAAREEDPVERMKYAVTFLISGLHRGGKQAKPFNPILGETFQAQYPDGSQVLCEQVSHHPPITAYQLLGPNGLWKLQGFNEYQASFRPNGLVCGQKGPNIIEFADGSIIRYNMPRVRISGAVMGDRLFSYFDSITFEDRRNHVRCTINFDPDALSGITSYIWSSKSPADTIRGELSHNNKAVAQVTGSWLEELRFDDECVWSIGQFEGLDPNPVSNPLASDCRNRSDLQALLENNLDLAEVEKLRLEEEQRRDRRLRKDAAVASQSS
jgi:Oxysterol-binding protein